MRPTRCLTMLAIVAALLLPLGCSEDGSTESSDQPTLDQMWPNEDGRFWSYDFLQGVWGTDENFAPSPLPLALPPLQELAALADDRRYPPGSTVATGTFRLEFSDSITISSGVYQNLVESLDIAPNVRASMRSAALPGFRLPASTEILSLSLHGGPWQKTTDRIAGFADLEGMIPWTYLESDLSTGHEFTLELFPGTDNETLLRARVLGRSVVETPSAIYTNATEVFYVLDFGVSEAMDEGGNFAGYLHQLSYGSIHFVPGVGPVAGYERMLSNFGPNGLERGYGELGYLLRSNGLTP